MERKELLKVETFHDKDYGGRTGALNMAYDLASLHRREDVIIEIYQTYDGAEVRYLSLV